MQASREDPALLGENIAPYIKSQAQLDYLDEAQIALKVTLEQLKQNQKWMEVLLLHADERPDDLALRGEFPRCRALRAFWGRASVIKQLCNHQLPEVCSLLVQTFEGASQKR